MIRICALACFLVLASTSIAPAQYVIHGDRGGRIGEYVKKFAILRASGQSIEIDGSCLSACTLLLGAIPHDRICITPRARLGFHAAWTPDANGRPVTSLLGTQVLRNSYPSDINRWIKRHGGLTRHMIYLGFKELRRRYRICGSENILAESPPRHRRTRRFASGR